MGFEAEQISVPGSIPLSGAIFMSNTSTMEECLNRGLFGLPSSFLHFVEQVRAGMILFLFDHETRLLHGVFQACSNGALNIEHDAYRSFGRQYPAQVKMTPLWHCNPLSEDKFRDAIKENYFSAYKFRFGLSEKQVRRLLSLFYKKKLNDVPLFIQSSRNNSSNTSRCSMDSKRRYIDDNRYALKDRIVDKRDIDDVHVREISEHYRSFIERDEVHKEQKINDEFFPDISLKDYYHPNVPRVGYDYDKNIELGPTPAEHSPPERFRRNNDGRINNLVSEYIEGCDFIPLKSVEQPRLEASDFSPSFVHDKAFLQPDQFRTSSLVDCNVESQDFIPLNFSYSGDEMEEKSHVFDHNAHRNRYSMRGVGDMSMLMQKYEYAESMIPSLRNPSDSVRVKPIDRWQGDSSLSSNNLYRAKYEDQYRILNDKKLSTTESFSSVPHLEAGNNWMENKVQFISPSKYARFSFCSPPLMQGRQEHQRAVSENEEALFHGFVPPEREPSHEKKSLDCDIEYQTSKREPFEDLNRESVFSRLTVKKSDKHVGYEGHSNNLSVDDIMAGLRRSSCMWRKSRVPTMEIQNFDDEENRKKKRKDFSSEPEVKEDFLTEEKSDDPICEETVFLDFKRRSQSRKCSDNLDPNNQTESVDGEDVFRSGQRKKRKLIRPVFHGSRLIDSNTNMKVQSPERSSEKVKDETRGSNGEFENNDTKHGNNERPVFPGSGPIDSNTNLKVQSPERASEKVRDETRGSNGDLENNDTVPEIVERPVFHGSGPIDSNTNLKVESPERRSDRVKVETRGSNRNAELLQAGCEGDSESRNENGPKVENLEALPSTSIQVSCGNSSLISAGGSSTQDITPIRFDSKS